VSFAQELDRPGDDPLHRRTSGSFRGRAPVPELWGIGVDLLREEESSPVREDHRCLAPRGDRASLQGQLLGLRSSEGLATAAPRGDPGWTESDRPAHAPGWPAGRAAGEEALHDPAGREASSPAPIW
jgi:hypothetical protein